MKNIIKNPEKIIFLKESGIFFKKVYPYYSDENFKYILLDKINNISKIKRSEYLSKKNSKNLIGRNVSKNYNIEKFDYVLGNSFALGYGSVSYGLE